MVSSVLRRYARFTFQPPGIDRGLDVHVVADAVSSCNPQEVPIALDRIRHAGGKVTTTESILFQLLGE